MAAKAKRKAKAAARAGARVLGLATDNPLAIAEMVQSGFAFSRLERLQKASALPWDKLARLVAIPPRTLTRRQSEGKLQPEESDRVWRASAVFDRAVDFFEGDVVAARRWLQTPQRGLGGAIPLEFAGTDVGAREVEDLLGRLEYGVIA